MIERLDGSPDRVPIDFCRVRAPGIGAWFRWLWQRLFGPPVKVDLLTLSLALSATMTRATMRDVDGTVLVMNRFRVFLSSEDFERLRQLVPRFKQGIAARLDEQADALNAETLGDWVVDLLVDDEQALPPLEGEILPEFVDNQQIGPVEAGELTIRVAPQRVIRSGAHPAMAPTVSAAEGREQPTTQADPGEGSTGSAAGGVIVRWADHKATVPTGQRRIFGRPPYGTPPPNSSLLWAQAPISARAMSPSRIATPASSSSASPESSRFTSATMSCPWAGRCSSDGCLRSSR